MSTEETTDSFFLKMKCTGITAWVVGSKYLRSRKRMREFYEKATWGSQKSLLGELTNSRTK